MIQVIMVRRRKQDYSPVLHAVKDLPQHPRVKHVVMDLKTQLVCRAVREVMPDVERTGCAFHLTQAMFRQILKST